MAPRATRSKEPSASDSSPLTVTDRPLNVSAFQLAPSSGLLTTSRGRQATENPLTGVVFQSVENGAQKVVVPCQLPDGSTADAKRVITLLRRDHETDPRLAEIRLNVQPQDGKGNKVDVDKATEVHFHANGARIKPKYTTDDIRAWYAKAYATDAGPAVLTGPVPKEIREQFKKANGYTKDDDQGSGRA